MSRIYPFNLVLHSEDDENLLREGLIVMHGALRHEWMESALLSRKNDVEREIKRIEVLLDALGWPGASQKETR